jgi:quercetin dioxygenase-like cupin family protein
MDRTGFEAALARDGFTEVTERALPPGQATPEHAHAFGVRALVLEGDITLTVDGRATTYRAGEVFTMDPNRPHAEAIGPEGVRYVAGRHYAAS